MTLATRSSSLSDTTSRQLLGVLGALAAMVLALAIAVQVVPSIRTGSDAGGGALTTDTYMSAPGISDPAGEHRGWGRRAIGDGWGRRAIGDAPGR